MVRNSRTIRCLVTASLSFSLMLSGFAPSLMASKARVPTLADAPRTCCCGTADGRCCPMACCISQSPPAPGNPVQLPTRDDSRPNLLAWERSDSSVLAMCRTLSLRIRPTTDADESPAHSSLQALHVRLDV